MVAFRKDIQAVVKVALPYTIYCTSQKIKIPTNPHITILNKMPSAFKVCPEFI